jgi:tetratricopeptide (TPR) repeat protein
MATLLNLDGMIQQREILKPINEAIDAGDFDLAIQLVNREMQSDTKYITWCLRKLASLYYLKGEYELARKIYEDVLSKRDIGWANLGLGKVNIALGRYEEAIEGLSSLIKQNGNMIEAYDWLAEAQIKKGKAKDAQATLKSAVAISPLAILRQTKLAEVCTKNKDVESAAEAFRQSVKLGFNSVHESPDNYLNLGKCLSDLSEGDTSELGKKRAKEAVHTLGRAAKKFKDNPDVKTSALLIESRVHKGQGDDNKSKTALEQAQQTMDMARASADTALEFAKTLYSIGEESQAEQLLSDLAGKHGDNQEILNEIEELLDEPVSLQKKVKARALNKQGIGAFETGDLAEAIKVFEDALLVTPKHPALNLNIVQVMLKQIKDQGGNPELKRKCDACLKNVQHIPSQHRQHKRYVYLRKKVDSL